MEREQGARREELGREGLQRAAAELIYLRSQAEAAQRQLATFRDLLDESEACEAALKNLKSEALIAIGAGTYLRTTQDPERVFVEVGSKVVAERSRQRALTLLSERRDALKRAIAEMSAALEKILKRIEQLNQLIARASKSEG